MAVVIRAADQNFAAGVAFNFDDMAVQAKSCLEKVQAEAAKIVAKAQAEAAAVRKQAELEGRQAALQAVEQMVAKQLADVLPAMRQAVEQIHHAKQAWLSHWEAAASALRRRSPRGCSAAN